ncbi:SDR family oxidoreductase [Escherichia coli]
MDFFSLKGKTAIVTGGNSGLGQAFAMALAKAGANVFIPSFVKDNGETKEMIEKQGVEVDFMQVDITAEGAPQKIIAACCERFGTVDILVNNAGICKLNKVLDFGRADWDNIQVNGIAPGYYATDITLATRSNPETNQRVLDHIPANRWGDTQDLMGAAVFLASPASNYVNGHLLVVDGGYLVR